ncbi:MAG: protein kinase [Propionibacteriaceae bacterium]|nr:protein kinase [Propionibacteriaceae bacterium]
MGSRYVADALIGRGGMGEVWRGRDVVTDRPVAVKFLRSDLVSQDDFVVRFLREARILKSLDDPRLVGIIDFVAEGSSLAIVMELVNGQNLASALTQHGRPPTERAYELVEATLQGLAVVHAAGVVHGDLKPANLLLPAEGPQAVRIADFGIARILEDAGTGETTSQVVGSPAYMAPELAMGSRPDRASDLYAVGIVAYELLSGAPPFHGGNPMSVLYRHQHAEPKRPSGVSDELWAWVAQLLAKDPADRPADATAALTQLRAITADHLTTQTLSASGGSPARSGTDTHVVPPPSRTQVLTSGTAAPAPPSRPVPAANPAHSGRRSWITGLVIGLLAIAVVVQGVLLMVRGQPAAIVAPPELPPTVTGGDVTPTPSARAITPTPRTGPGVRRTAGPLPNVVGMHVSSAEVTLESYGYVVHRREQIDDNRVDGEVVGQEPGAGGQPADGTVLLTVSRRSSVVWLAGFQPVAGKATVARVDLPQRSFAWGILLEPACAEPAGVSYALDRRYARLTTVLAVDPGSGASAPSEPAALRYRITVDGREVGSGELQGVDGQHVQLNLDGGASLRIEASTEAGGCGPARLALGDPILTGLPD